MRSLLRTALWLLGVNAAAWLLGRYLGRQLSSGDEASDRFTVATIYGGDSFSSRAAALRSGHVRVLMGGVMLDLREAELDPDGAHLTVEVTAGGAMIRVGDTWRVGIDEDLKAAEIQVDVTPPEALPLEAPELHIRVVARAGGVTITAAPGALHV